MKFYKKEAENTIGIYNDAVDSADTVTGGKASKGFGKINTSSGNIAPIGTRVPKKGGGFYTSDGKGGWK